MLTVEALAIGRSTICREILDDLPEWFGIAKSKAEYVRDAADLPMFGCFIDRQLAGFVAFRQQTQFALDVFVLGVKRRFHRRGVGRMLIDEAVRYATSIECPYLTVGGSHPDPFYAITRGFYEAVGFHPLEEFPTLWDADGDNPCLLMIKVRRAVRPAQ